MKALRSCKLAVLIVAAITWTAPAVFSQTGNGTRPQRPNRTYDPATEITVKGTVETLKTISGQRGMWRGTHLILKTESGEFDVHLGPATYLKEKNFEFAKGDKIEVIGSKTRYQEKDAIIAREVKQGERVLVLRDDRGIPQWAGGRGWRKGPAVQ